MLGEDKGNLEKQQGGCGMKQIVEEAARIEREKILQELKDGYSKHKDVSLYNAFAATIEKYAVPLFKAGSEWQVKQSPWISVEERLPENDENNFFINCRSNAVGTAYYKDGNWYSSYSGEVIYGITHWLPISAFAQIIEAIKDVLQQLKDK